MERNKLSACYIVAKNKTARSSSVKRVSKVMAAYFWREHTNIIGFVMKKL